jgi:hypothetical protein
VYVRHDDAQATFEAIDPDRIADHFKEYVKDVDRERLPVGNYTMRSPARLRQARMQLPARSHGISALA